MHLLVTGGAGFIGSHFIDYVLQNHPEDQVVCLDSLTYAGNLDNLARHCKDERFRFVRGDIRCREQVYALLDQERVDCVVNFAAQSHVDRSLDDPAPFLETNLLGVGVLLDGVNRFSIPRFHQISTDEVYGQLPLDRPELRFREDSPLRPSSPYSASKAGADLLALSYFRSFATPVTITRSSNNYGPRQHPEKLIPRMISRALAHQPMPIYGDGQNVRDWLYVTDHCAAVDLIIRRGRPGQVYNVGGGAERSNLELVTELLRQLDRPQSLLTFIPDRRGHDRRYAVDWERLRNELGWRPYTPLKAGLKRTLDWYLAHPERLDAGQ